MQRISPSDQNLVSTTQLEQLKQCEQVQTYENLEHECKEAAQQLSGFLEHLEQVIRGKRTVLEKVVACLISGGHLLLEDNPGVGKTTLAKVLAKSLNDCSYSRIQFTPDLLPYDVTGVEIWQPDTHTFKFHSGPIFCNLLLADEINRATPKVQSALLEVMAEQQVTIGKVTYSLADPFWVIATQNPIEMAGTYLLPKAQMDRFAMRLSVGYPNFEEELAVLRTNPTQNTLPQLEPFLNLEELLHFQKLARQVYCQPELEEWVVRFVRMTREHAAIRLGASSRGALMWLAVAKSYALLQGRYYVVDTDLCEFASAVLLHRLELRQQHDNPQALFDQLLQDAKRKLPKMHNSQINRI